MFLRARSSGGRGPGREAGGALSTPWQTAELVLCGRGGRPAAPCPAHLPWAHPALCPGQLLSPSLALIGAAGTLTALGAVQQVPPWPLLLLPCSRGAPPPLAPGLVLDQQVEGPPQTPARAGARICQDSPPPGRHGPPQQPLWNECIFSWAEQRPVGVQVSVGVCTASWVTLGLSEPWARFLAGRGSPPAVFSGRCEGVVSRPPFPGCSPLPLTGPLGSPIGGGAAGPRPGWSLDGASSAGSLLFNIKSRARNCIRTCIIIRRRGEPSPW